MKTFKSLQNIVWAGVVVFTVGCVRERVEYRTTALPPAYEPGPVATAPPPVISAPAPALRSSAELEHMLGPIALYPDPLTAEILPASTMPDQLVQADRYLRERGDLARVDYQPWEQSVKGLTRYPEVLRMMVENLGWTEDIGVAFVNQPVDVMEAIQRLRAQARAIGNLRTTPEQIVVVENRVIQIVPARPEIIYVPIYRPEVVYVQPPPRIGVHIVFGGGRPVGPWLNQDVNWRNHDVIVWRNDHPRPRDWWYQPPSRQSTTVVNNTTIVNNYTVWRPQNPPQSGQGNRDRDRNDNRGRNSGSPGNSSASSGRSVGSNSRVISSPKQEAHSPQAVSRPTAGRTTPREWVAPKELTPLAVQVTDRPNTPAVAPSLPRPAAPTNHAPTVVESPQPRRPIASAPDRAKPRVNGERTNQPPVVRSQQKKPVTRPNATNSVTRPITTTPNRQADVVTAPPVRTLPTAPNNQPTRDRETGLNARQTNNPPITTPSREQGPQNNNSSRVATRPARKGKAAEVKKATETSTNSPASTNQAPSPLR